MFLTSAIVLGILGHLSSGVPLEDSSADFSQFFNDQRIIRDSPAAFSDQRIVEESEGVFNDQRIVGDAQVVLNNERIVGGSQAEKGKTPFMVGLVIGFTWRSFVCGGSIISKSHIMTAAHCITGFINWDGLLMDTFHGVVGSNTWYNGTVVYFKDYRIHQDYDSMLIKNDIGILITKDTIQLNERVAIIAINFDFIDGQEKSYVTGWGTEWLWGNLPSKLKILIVNTISHKECKKGIIAAAESWGGWAPPVEKFLEICTFHSPGNGMCHGDSGSPLVREACGSQIGIVSWGVPCARGGPDVFVRVGYYVKWIKNILKNH